MVLANATRTIRDELYDEEAPADDPTRRPWRRALQGQQLPMVDRVEVYIVEENQPRWLAFLNGEHDVIEEVPADFANLAIPNNQLAPNLRKLGIQMVRYARADVAVSYFAMENPRRRRLRAAEGRAAARDRPRGATWNRRSAPCASGQAVPAQIADPAGHLGLRAGFPAPR